MVVPRVNMLKCSVNEKYQRILLSILPHIDILLNIANIVFSSK